ncbi:MAG: nitrate reductase molybdenum cofactor assembly chaperone [Piscinibacter sp.]|uniref:nitrate reductase molybdenum cofactor assembly chaperone n=1 Tax=Piscinibacter sp. TaxID=1903157 RepID=UPI0025834915|nr:nitrate reductase molybdenum cofactor assembly chaperone [Piscinibacter sp.]MCW5667699.1 nitrate reductase molybdenum cofactor assembly chaperone [Piscinibacter sp.]
MDFFAPPDARLTLRVLARLLAYPDAELRAHLPELREALRSERALGLSRRAELEALMDGLAASDPLAAEAVYVELFDRGRSTSLHLFEHVHGDSRDRGPAMIDLIRTYEQAGLLFGPDELPDHLCVLLEFASTLAPRAAREFLAETAHLLAKVFSALLERGSPYASVLGAVIELAGEKAQAVPVASEPALDEAWEEPAAFDGCSTQGQARPGTPQPVQIVRKPPQTHPTQGAHA